MSFVQTLTRWRVAASGIAAALVLTLLIGFTPQGQSAAAQFLAQFRSQRFTVVALDPDQAGSPLLQLRRLGTVTGLADDDAVSAEEVGSVAEASQRLGFTVKEADPATLPDGIAPTPMIQVSSESETRFTFDKHKAQAYFDSIGRSDVSLPDRLDGATLVVSIPAAVLLQYPDSSGDGPGLIVGQARELTVGVESTSGVTLEELRTFLLGLPGIPAEARQQIEAIEDWRNTLPIPIPVDDMNWQETAIGGGQGLILADNTGLGSGAIWQHDGLVYGVAGAVKASEIERIASGLR